MGSGGFGGGPEVRWVRWLPCSMKQGARVARVRFIAQHVFRLRAAGWGAVGRRAERVRVGDNGSLRRYYAREAFG